jgi:hypothetical protein
VEYLKHSCRARRCTASTSEERLPDTTSQEFLKLRADHALPRNSAAGRLACGGGFR